MGKGLVIVDAGPIFSLAIIDKLNILHQFKNIRIPRAVWEEITQDTTKEYYLQIHQFFKDKIQEISKNNDLSFAMDYGESESVILYQELKADYLLIDDKKARNIAENYGIKCIGTLGLLAMAKDQGLIQNLKPLFEKFLSDRRYYSEDLLNAILIKYNENILDL